MNLLPPPGPERTRQLVALTVLMVILGGVVWYFFGPTTQTASPVTASNSPNRAGQK